MTIFTIGHSTRALDELLALLREQGIARLADIRRYPGSRRYPHFSSEALGVSLPEHGIEYIHMPSLGGRRKPEPDSPNTFWRNDQFRAYADHMASAEFRTAVDELLTSAERTVTMCAEAVPWRCHRNLLSDELVRRGLEVLHIIGPGAVQPHALNPAARPEGDHLIYPAEAEQTRIGF
jgi:uncharacterized protein (DUF488 family)